MLSTAVRIPVAVGAKATPITQVLPGATVPQVLELVTKSPGFAPVKFTLPITSGARPQLVMITLCTELVVVTKTVPKLTGLPSKQTDGVRGMPTPCRRIDDGPPA